MTIWIVILFVVTARGSFFLTPDPAIYTSYEKCKNAAQVAAEANPEPDIWADCIRVPGVTA
jgi:hypothetical protein